VIKVHSILNAGLDGAADFGRRAEAIGFDGIWATETSSDPFLPLLLAADATERVTIGTAIAVAFPRSPLHLAHTARDIHHHSKGRFVLGLGSQVRAHIERRYSASYEPAVPRMRELVLAVRAIWAAWQDGAPLDFRGEFYTHTLMTPFFAPPASEYGVPPIFLAAVGPRMTEAAGEVADGIFVHGLTTEKYLREVAFPAIERGLSNAGRQRSDLDVCRPLFLVTGATDEERAKADAWVRDKLAFYASTPTYRPILELHGWGDLQPQLAALAKRGSWSQMPHLIDDEMLATFAIVGEMAELPRLIYDRYDGLVDRVSFTAPITRRPDEWGELIASLHRLGTESTPAPSKAGSPSG
jgi:probable F420-dependent oxidoreductase